MTGCHHHHGSGARYFNALKPARPPCNFYTRHKQTYDRVGLVFPTDES
jgi:hypothetical protein